MSNSEDSPTPLLDNKASTQQKGTSTESSTEPEALALHLEKFRESIKKDIQKEVKEIQVRYTEILAVFVALFTFVSIEFQLIKTFNYIEFIFFSSFFAGLLIFFTLALHIIIYNKINKKALIIILIMMACFTISAAISEYRHRDIRNSQQSRNLDIKK